MKGNKRSPLWKSAKLMFIMPATKPVVRLQEDKIPAVKGSQKSSLRLYLDLTGLHCKIEKSAADLMDTLRPLPVVKTFAFIGLSCTECREMDPEMTEVNHVVRFSRGRSQKLDERVSPSAPFFMVDQMLRLHEENSQLHHLPFDEAWACLVSDPKSPRGYSIVLIQWGEGTLPHCTISFWGEAAAVASIRQPALDTCLFVFGRQV